jgi:hypothetical protein
MSARQRGELPPRLGTRKPLFCPFEVGSRQAGGPNPR